MTDTLNVGIIGCGVIAPVHLYSYANLENVRVRAICDIKHGPMEALAAKRPDLDLDRFDNADDMFAKAPVDAVSVCTDHASHTDLVVKALNAGKHVLCEKALGVDLAGLDRMVSTARRTRRVAAGVFQHRFDPLFRALDIVLKEEQLGRILNIGFRHSCHRPPSYYADSDWRGTWEKEGGSLLINQSIHFLDILRWLNNDVLEVSAITANLAHEEEIETEDAASLCLRFGNGAVGNFLATSASHQDWRWSLRATGTEGEILLADGKFVECDHLDPVKAEAIRRQLTDLDEIEGVAVAKDYYGTSHPAQIADFVRAIQTGGQPFVTLEDASLSVQLVLGAYQAARENRTVKLF